MTWNVVSLVFGISAWCIGFAAIKSKKKSSAYSCSVTSFSLCAVSLFLQFLEIGNRVNAGDYAGIEDTIGAVIFAAGVLTAVTIVLNVVTFVRRNDKNVKL